MFCWDVYALDYNPTIFTLSLLFYFIFLIFFYFARLYLNAKSFIVIVLIILLIILYQYFVMYLYIFERKLELSIIFTNFTVGDGIIDFNIIFHINSIGYLFSLLVFVIAFCTNMYSLNYFKNEADEMGFVYWLNCFVMSMVILIIAGNFFTLFLGWELIGLTSFFLINFWQTRRSTLKSSFKALTFNLISDLSLLVFFSCMYSVFQTTDINNINTLVTAKMYSFSNDLYIGITFLIICTGIKSVQFIGHLWLPDSMEAPVPASALIHSATLVSAGIYLLLRFKFLIIELNVSYILINIGAFTAAYGGVVATAQTDVKKLLAYSTMSHCGFLYMLVGFGDEYITISYLFLHGIFKAATFYCVGSFIRIYGSQDTRVMGGGAQLYWGDSFFLLLCSVNLCGLPLTVGYTYKILFFKVLFVSSYNFLTLGFIFIALLSSVVYFFRLIYYCLFDYYKMLFGINPVILQATKNFRIENRWYKYPMFWDSKADSRIVTFGVWFTLFLLFIFIFYLYTTISYFNESFFRYDDILTDLYSTSNLHTYFIKKFYKIHLLYFYIIYMLILLLLVLVTWRKNIFDFETKILYIFCIIALIYVVLTCEATL